ncbi:helix-turn-helix transcriptional regulator, partial [Staphylococcus sp. SIMBA_130]
MSVKYGILTLLYLQENHGYELKLELESLLGTKGKINPGQIYTTLDRLIRDLLVSSVGMDDQERKLY